MVLVVDAVFDGQVLRPDEPLKLEKNARVRLTVESVESKPVTSVSFLDVAMSLNLDGPSDWSENFEEYLDRDKRSAH